jgi:predicted TIM-barrel fold metal-dependent hydrolase
MRKVSIVSVDGHAVMPAELWPEYLEARFHDQLPRFEEENVLNAKAMLPLNDVVITPNLDLIDGEGAYRSGGWEGAWDADVRLSEMDREGVAAEIVHHGFFRVPDLGFSVMNARYPDEVVDAGVRAHDRWAHDTFGGSLDRLLLVGSIGTCTDLDATIAEVEWVADHGFVGTYAPGFTAYPGQRPLDDPWWDPLWATYAERGVALVVHGGYGLDQGFAYDQIAAACQEVEAAGGGDTELVAALAKGIFSAKFFDDLRHRRAMVQLMLGGVFDRHPSLRLAMTEVRADWLPATLGHLDEVFEERRDRFGSARRPSEWWRSNCVVGASFTHKSEIAMRDEIGVDTLCFGRDYPHAEGTWPNTAEYLRDLLAGVDEHDARCILGENLMRFLGFDADRTAAIAAIADRIGPSIDDVTGGGPVDPALVAHLGQRCGYLKPAEGDRRLDELDELLAPDLARMAAPVG